MSHESTAVRFVRGAVLAPILLVVSQSLSPSPLLEVQRSPLEEPAAVTSLRTIFEANVVSVEPGFGGFTLRRGARSWSLTDDEWPAAFESAAEIKARATSLRDALKTATLISQVGIGIEVAGAVGALSLLLLMGTVAAPTLVIAAIVCGAVGLTGGIVALFSLPGFSRSNEIFALVGEYNRGLAHAEIPAATPALSIPLP